MAQEILTQEKVNGICAHLEQTAAVRGVNLNKDTASLEYIEGILLSLKSLGDEGALAGASFRGALYVGEVLRHGLGGEWVFADDRPPCVRVGDQVHDPMEAVQRFIHDEEDAGLVLYAQALVAGRSVAQRT